MMASAPLHAVVGLRDVALPHDDLGLAQEALDAVVEHHDELDRGCRQHRGFAVRLRAGVGGQVGPSCVGNVGRIWSVTRLIAHVPAALEAAGRSSARARSSC